jgi:hypothetical protein
MNKFSGVVVLAGFALSGCVTKTPEKPIEAPSPIVNQRAPVSTPSASAQPVVVSTTPATLSSAPAQTESASPNQLRVQQCRKELDAMKLYNKASYDKYESEFQVIASKANKYMQVKDSMSADLNDIVMPGYQFQIREFCFRVKSRLSQLVIRQAR